MLTLHVIQAYSGDCLLLEDRKQFILIDGGPANTYFFHLKHALDEIISGSQRISLIILTHIDNDHIWGINDLLKQVKTDQKKDPSSTIKIDGIWHNLFFRSGRNEDEISSRMFGLVEETELCGKPFNYIEVVRGFKQGEQTSKLAGELGIPLNEGFRDRLIILENAPAPWTMGDIKIWILGPSRQVIERLQSEWLEWLDQNFSSSVKRGARETSIPNLSSIMVLIEADGRRILLPGDGTGSELLEGLHFHGLLSKSGKIHVDILKLPHHGSKRNVSDDFFERVTADSYIISAQKDHPDFETLEWIIQSAQRKGRKIRLISTNVTNSTWELEQKYRHQNEAFELIYLRADQHYLTV